MPEQSLDIFEHVQVETADREEQKIYGRKVLDELPQVRMRMMLRQTSEYVHKQSAVAFDLSVDFERLLVFLGKWISATLKGT